MEFMMTVQEKFGSLVRDERRNRIMPNGKKMTQENLAEASDLSTRYISNIENGLVNPSLDVAVRLATVLNIDLNLLWKEEG